MCGIVGVIETGAGSPDVDLLRRMAREVAHRGPDGEGYWVQGRIGFGHRRLAIIDVAGSPQPMHSADGSHTICFNGEILNYGELRRSLAVDWSTHGDTEVLLELMAAHGPAALGRLRGQFAFALYDHTDGTVLLVRDRIGILPLFWARTATGVVFASEVKALRPALGELVIDPDSLPDSLALRAVPAPHTLFAGVHKVLPGSWVRIPPDGRVEEGRYWSLDAPRPRLDLSPLEAVDELERLLGLAVEESLVADVPVGAYLSGGVDSSVTVALAARAAKAGRLATFSATFPGSPDDEGEYARRVSARIGTDHHEVAVDPAEFWSELWRLAWYRDLPISQTSDVAVAALARLAAQHVTVVISGEGGDELFGGYPKYRLARATRAAGALPAVLRQPLVSAARRVAGPRSERLDVALRALEGRTERDRLDGWFASFSEREIARLCRGRRRAVPVGPALHGDAVTRMSLVDLSSWLADNLLERGDRMTMASSIELRPPFLDARVVEFALSLPSSIKVRGGVTKWPVKELARRFVDAEVIDRPKVGFKVPIGEWFRTSLADDVRGLLQSDASRCREWLDTSLVDRLVTDHLEGRADRSKQLWPLVSLEVWARTVLERSGPVEPAAA
jgi:asparagine synthase (glutamine-hydrolysing)